MLTKLFYSMAGFILLLLGLLGLIVPILPGVVFLFLAIVCFARVSSGLQAWLDNSHRFNAVELKMRVWLHQCVRVLQASSRLLVNKLSPVRQSKWSDALTTLIAGGSRRLRCRFGK
ncbi:MAG: DUF454 family protein [Pseudomonadales bacterium]|nr:DUF454 family protein [Pseudomonadales bacterium]